MRPMFILVALLGALFLWDYAFNDAEHTEVRRALDARHAATRP